MMVSSSKLFWRGFLGLVITVVGSSGGGGMMMMASGLTSTSTKYCTTRRWTSSSTPSTKFSGKSKNNNLSRKEKATNTGAGGVYTSYHWRSNTLLTSSHVEARHLSHYYRWSSMLSRWATTPLQWKSQLMRTTKGHERLILSVILTAILLFAPAFSPAARAASSSSVAAAATAGRIGISPYIPFSAQSRALGTFSFLPNKAEMELCFRLLYAACLGAFVGLERSSSECPAGVRTMALVGLGAATYTICSTHGFLPHSALGFQPGSPFLDSVKCDLSRMASNIASGVGFIGAGAIHKSTLRKDGTEAQNFVSGLTTASAIWVSAAVGIASAVGLYFTGAVATFATVAILKYARLPKYEVNRSSTTTSWEPKALVVEKDHEREYPPHGPTRQRSEYPVHGPQNGGYVSGLFGKYEPTTQKDSSSDHNILERYSADNNHPIIIKEVIDPRFEQYLRSRLGMNPEVVEKGGYVPRESKVLIEEEQAVISEREQGPTTTSFEP